ATGRCPAGPLARIRGRATGGITLHQGRDQPLWSQLAGCTEGHASNHEPARLAPHASAIFEGHIGPAGGICWTRRSALSRAPSLRSGAETRGHAEGDVPDHLVGRAPARGRLRRVASAVPAAHREAAHAPWRSRSRPQEELAAAGAPHRVRQLAPAALRHRRPPRRPGSDRWRVIRRRTYYAVFEPGERHAAG